MWRVISFAVFAAVILTWVYVPQVKKLGFPALLVLIGLGTLCIYYFQLKSGYNPLWYYQQPLVGTYMSPK